MTPRRTLDRDALLDAMADHVLEHGLSSVSLRPLAASAGTSDRMLIYHFGSKDELLGTLVDHLAARMTAGLEAALPQRSYTSTRELIVDVVTLLRSPPFAPYGRVWLDIVAAAGAGVPSHRDAGFRVIEGYLDWVAARIPKGKEAGLALALVEGTLVLDAVGQSAAADAAIAALPTA